MSPRTSSTPIADPGSTRNKADEKAVEIIPVKQPIETPQPLERAPHQRRRAGEQIDERRNVTDHHERVPEGVAAE